MAKVRGFLRGAKGKVGDFVLQKGEKSTVLRANNGVANPQSAAQMSQRVTFGTVTNAAKKLLSVIGLSFYGVSNGKLSRRRFVELNIPVLKASADAQLAGEESSFPTCYFKAKDCGQLVVNPYIVSDGNLILPEQWVPMVLGTPGGDFGLFEDDQVSWSKAKGAQVIDGASLISAMYGVSAGEQITLVTIVSKDGDAVPYQYEGGDNVTVNGVPVAPYDWQRFTQMWAPRIVFKSSNLPSLEIVADETTDTLQPKLITCLLGCIDLEKSSQFFVNQVVNLAAKVEVDENIHFWLEPWEFKNDTPTEGWRVQAAGVVRSANVDGQWDFSRCQLVISMDPDSAGGPENNNDYSGLFIGTAIYSYVGVADSGAKNFMTTGTPFEEMPQQA